MTTPEAVNEADPADVAEQRESAARDEPTAAEFEVPLEATEADAAEQAVEVDVDEEYRG